MPQVLITVAGFPCNSYSVAILNIQMQCFCDKGFCLQFLVGGQTEEYRIKNYHKNILKIHLKTLFHLFEEVLARVFSLLMRMVNFSIIKCLFFKL